MIQIESGLDEMLVADALIEYGFRHLDDAALFSRCVEVLRKIEYPATADSLQRYRDSAIEIVGNETIVSRIEDYSRRVS